MTITNPALNIPFAAEQAARVQVLDRTNAEALGERLKKAASETPFAAGTTVTARYRYKIAADGSFIPLQTQITADDVEEATAAKPDGRRNRQSLRQYARDKAPSFRDFAVPKPQLAPSDEAVIFSSLASALPSYGVSAYAPKISLRVNTNIGTTPAQDELGNSVETEALTLGVGSNSATEQTSFSASFRRAQSSVASLYAQTGALPNQPVSDVLIAA